MRINRHSFALTVLVLSGCTFGVDAVELRAEDAVDAAEITKFREDLSHVGALQVRGIEEPMIRAALVARGLIGPGEAEAARESLQLALYVEGTVAGVTTSIDGPYAELLDPTRVELDVPAAMAVELTLGSTSAHVSDVLGLVAMHGTSGSVVIADADALDVDLQSGSIAADARSALLRTVSGSMELVLSEHVDARATSGSIHVRLAGGGELHTDSGAMEITLEGPLTEDLNVSANDGSVRIRMPAGIGAALDLDAGNGSVVVDAGGRHFGGESFVGTIGAGGHTIRVRTADGSIAVDAADEGR